MAAEQKIMVVEFRAAPGRRAELRAELLLLVAPTRAEDGCILYDLHESTEDPDVFAFYEIWASDAAHRAHDLTPHVGRIRAALKELAVAGGVRKLLLRRAEPAPAPALAPPRAVLRVALDWTPNANHVGLFAARARGLFAARGLDVVFLSPADDAYARSPARAVLDGAADLAVAPSESAIAHAAAGAAKLVAVAALLQRDTSAIAALAGRGVARPRDLDGKVYASYAARYELATVRALVRADGGRGDLAEVVPPRLACFDEVLAGRADATWIFAPHEGVAAAARGVALAAFCPSDYGIPYGYSPVLLAAPALLAARGGDVRALLAAAGEGYRWAAAEPDAAADALRAESGDAALADAAFARASVRAVAPALLDAAGAWGAMEAARWDAFVAFLGKEGLLVDRAGAPVAPAHLPTAARVATNEYL